MTAPPPLTFTVGEPAPRLDLYLAGIHPALSRSRWKQLIQNGHVTLNGSPALKPHTPLAPGDTLLCAIPPDTPAPLTATPIPLDILHEDTDILVLNKPPGLVVHPAPGHATDTLVNALIAHCPGLPTANGQRRPGIVHRLDKDTSGLLVVAKTEPALANLIAQFAAGQVEREYLALVWGVPSPPSGAINQPIGRHPVHRKKMAVIPAGRPALTRYQVLAAGPLASLLRLELLTGRTHQIRVHLAHLLHPVVGDTTYGRARANLPPGLALPRQMLHAHTLRLRHPATARPLAYTAPPPPDFLTAQHHLLPSAPTP